MIIHYLKASGFRIMGEPTDIKFPEEGKIGILGQNESGKTTLLQAIEYALYGLRKGAGVEGERENLVTWGKNEARLEIEFTSGQETYTLQRIFGVRSGHKASLTTVINGVGDRSSAVTSLGEIETKIEQITGMDRDSFTKLIYIRQKDLDALKELAKSRREQLVNKVMGIEIFDDAVTNVRADIASLQFDLDRKNDRLLTMRMNKEKYEVKQQQKAELEQQIADLKKDLKQKKTQLDKAQKLLGKYEWLYTYDSTNNVLSSLKAQMQGVERDIEKTKSLKNKINENNSALDKYKPQINDLQILRDTFSNLERGLKETKDAAMSTEEKKQNLITRTGLSGKDLQLLSKNLPAMKNQRLTGFCLGIAIGICLLMIGLTVNNILIPLSFVLFAISVYFFRGYVHADKLVTTNAEITSLAKQLEEQHTKITDLNQEIAELTVKTSFKSKEEVNGQLSTFLIEVNNLTGQDSIEGLAAVTESLQGELNSLESQNPLKKKEEIGRQIDGKEREQKELQKTKPASVSKIKYSKEQHETVKGNYQAVQNDYGQLQQNMQNKLGTTQQLSKDIEELEPDYELYPQLEEEVTTNQAEIDLLKRVLYELSETSKEMRNKVIPHARFIINQILPTLTDDRYSDLEITEDLKFKVHSREAGGYKEREIFSGGTQDQFLIALRLAFTQSILDSRVMADKYMLLMDECISSSDDTRKQGIFEVLEAMKKTFSQIFIIAHEDISNFVDHYLTLTRNEYGYTDVRSKSWENV